ncbi:MAG: MoaD/ThiS family protein [Lewinellaceae bacterium]|nr:MoaD/ThiS family protein [Saprospiraceae bacterium]MCB9330430.1 MoaD/ThiS family protein [Lewinellaceae bacterium]
MKIKVLTFGVTRDIIGEDVLFLDLPAGSTVADVRTHLTERFPPIEKLASLMFAVNAEYATSEAQLAELDELALIPPVSGG